jgi:branched-chain amino acid transport system substrate-binding protein
MSALETRLGALVVIAGVVLVFALAACGGEDDPSSTNTSRSGDASVKGLDLANCAEPEYGGDEQPAGLIVSDLPMQGDSAERSEQQAEAVRIVLGENDWKAGETPVAFQACDDSIAKTGLWDEATCEENARAYAADERVLAVIGTYNSGCAAIEIPILGKAGVAMVSPGNTAVCLTEPSSNCEDGQPKSLYPSARNYARVIPNDAFQGAALATYLDDSGSVRPFVAYAAGDPTSTGQATNFRGAAEELGMAIAGFEAWNPDARDYRAFFTRAEKAGADAVVLAGLTEQNGARVIADKVEYVGDNSQVPLLAFDGFAQQTTIDEAGGAAKGMFAGLPGVGGDDLPGAGQDLVAQLEENLGAAPIEQFAPYAGQAAQVALYAIKEEGTDRSAISAALFGARIEDGIVGSFELTERGDPSVGPITLLEAGESFEPAATVRPDEAVVTAARG